MRHSSALCLLVLSTSLLISACQTFAPETSDTQSSPNNHSRQAWEHLKPGCQGQDCPLMNIDTLHYPNEPRLNQAIEQGLLQLANPDQQWPSATTLKEFEQTFLTTAEPRWANYVQAKQRAMANDLIVVELSSYLERGGAHGIPGRGFINYRPSSQSVITLQQMLIPGQEERFWAIAEHAHRLWLMRSQLDLDPEFSKAWPFQKTTHIALLPEHLLLKYDVYAIAPYSSGHPEIAIDYSALRGILKPEFMPASYR